MAAERPGVLERLGSALNSSDLAPREEKIGAVELIGAMAYTQTNPDAAAHVEIESAVIDPRTELASILVRLKYGGDRVLGDRAAHLLVHWVRHQKAFGKWKLRPGSDGMIERFVRQGLAEWLYPVCPECQGREYLGMDKGEVKERRIGCTRCRRTGVVDVTSNSGVRVRRDCLGCGGNGWRMHRRVSQTKAKACDKCSGTGRRRPNDSERALLLVVDHRVYQRHWLKRFDWLASGLDRLDTLQKWCLQSQMKAGINPA